MISREHRLIREAFKRGYRVEPDGAVITPTGRRLSGCLCGGYVRITLWWDELRPRGQQVYQHQMVAYAKFGEAMFAVGIEVRHRDAARKNNDPKNLILGTRLENIMDKTPEQRRLCGLGKKSVQRRLSMAEVIEIRAAVGPRGLGQRLATRFNVSATTISEIRKGKSYAA